MPHSGDVRSTVAWIGPASATPSPVPVLLVRRRSAGRRQVAGVVPATLGLAMLVGPPAGHVLIAVAFAVLAAAGFSAMTLGRRRCSSGPRSCRRE